MKKGLLSILAGALVVVGCQNYDDQFDNLESQISALASTVAGLSQVQSDLASLAGTVSSLASTVNGLGDTIDTAVADGLTDIQSDIDAIEAAVADVASSEEVSALSDAVADSQEDLDELLANSSVFTGDVVVNSVATLDAYHAMGSSIAIVNGRVDIDVNAQMDVAKVQELVDQILTVTKDFDYTSSTSAIAEVTFNNLTGVQSLTLEQAGGYQAQALVSAKNITLSTKFSSKITKIDFRELTSVQKFIGGSTDNTIDFSKATELHLTKLVYYPATTLVLKIDEGGALPLAIDDVDADGDQRDINLTIEGPDNVTIENIEDGTLTFAKVKTLVVNGFKGGITVGADVESFTADSYTDLSSISGATDLETLNVTGVADPDDSKDKDGAPISISGNSNIESVTLAGKIASVTLENNSSLTDVTINATVDGSITIGSTNGNSDLTSVTLTGSTVGGAVNVEKNSDLTALTIDVTFAKSVGPTVTADTKLDGVIKVNDNDGLESLTVSSDKLETLTITNNDNLATLDFTGVTAIGETGKPSVTIKDNNLSASAVNTEDDAGATKTADFEANDKGSFTTSSGMETLKDYLTAVDADADATAEVLFDTIESYTDEDDSESADITTGDNLIVLKLVAEVKKNVFSDTTEKRSWLISDNATAVRVFISGVDGLATGTTLGRVVLTGERALDLLAIKSELATTRATALGATISVKKGGNAYTPTVTFRTSATRASNGEYYNDEAAAALHNSASAVTTYDEFTLSVGGRSVRASVTAPSIGYYAGAYAASAVGNALSDAWLNKYSDATAASGTMSFWTTGTGSLGQNDDLFHSLALKSSNSGSRADADTVAVAWVTKATTAQVSLVTSGVRTQTVMDWIIGATEDSDDNVAVSTGIILSYTEVVDGAINGTSLKVSNDNNDQDDFIQEITTNLRNNVDSPAAASAANTNTTSTIYPTDGRGDAVFEEAGSEGEVTTAGVDKSRVHWL